MFLVLTNKYFSAVKTDTLGNNFCSTGPGTGGQKKEKKLANVETIPIDNMSGFAIINFDLSIISTVFNLQV